MNAFGMNAFGMNAFGLRRIAVASVALAGLLAVSLPAHAYRMIQNTSTGRLTSGSLVTCSATGGFLHWTNPNIVWRLNTAGQGSGKATAITNALNSWTAVANADHNLTYGGTTTAGWTTDGINTMLWASGNGCTGSCLALTAIVVQSGQVIVESDVTYNSNYTWNTNGSDYDTQAVVAHELGHSLGIHHTQLTTTPRPTMYASYFGTDGRSLHSDDIAALQCAQTKYPFPGTGGAPGTPAYMEVIPDYCFGGANLNWVNSAGTTYYEVQIAYNSSYTGASLIYSGPNAYTFHNGGMGTKYYRVRACNGSGCSGYRNGDQSVGYWDPCL